MTEQEYQKEIDFIFNQFPSYQKVGKIAYKPGIETMRQMDAVLGHPHRKFKTIHIAGTNGKGSVSHMTASALMRLHLDGRPLRVGLYTSPHLVDFRERIKVNGEEISKAFVYDFIVRYKDLFLEKKASFFEITTAMAFAYFAVQHVDIAVIECGLGGRLDSTNIITPVLSVITNIGLDHCEYLGYTYKEIAAEKAGIMKEGVPVVIGERGGQYPGESFVSPVFEAKAASVHAPVCFAEDTDPGNTLLRLVDKAGMDLQGECQDKNIKTVCSALAVLTGSGCIPEDYEAMAAGIMHAARDTGLRGRWEKLGDAPLVICDTGHNAHGFQLLGHQIDKVARKKGRLLMVFGVVADKDLNAIKNFLPDRYGDSGKAYYYYVNASGVRALEAGILQEKMSGFGFSGEAVTLPEGMPAGAGTVKEGVKRALRDAGPDDFIFIGGSTFVVAEALECFQPAEK